MDFKDKHALVTGASAGLGAAFAEALAQRGAHLTLVARSEARLEELAKNLTAKYGVQVRVIAQDLTLAGAAQRVFEKAQGDKPVQLLVNNAGFGKVGRFESLALDSELQMVMLNVSALLEMTHLFLPGMQARGSGVVINVASTAAFQPLPYMATYGATKAFVLSFSEALWAENREKGVQVLALCPGATDTEFFKTAGSQLEALGNKAAPERVVQCAFDALEEGRSYAIFGTRNFMMANLNRLAPRDAVARMSERLMRTQ